MDRCAVQFIARRWWRRAEIWVIASLLIIGGGIVGFQISQWSLASSYLQQVTVVRQAYDEALKQRDARMDTIATKIDRSTETANHAASTATQAADSANKAADKAVEAVERAGP